MATAYHLLLELVQYLTGLPDGTVHLLWVSLRHILHGEVKLQVKRYTLILYTVAKLSTEQSSLRQYSLMVCSDSDWLNVCIL